MLLYAVLYYEPPEIEGIIGNLWTLFVSIALDAVDETFRPQKAGRMP